MQYSGCTLKCTGAGAGAGTGTDSVCSVQCSECSVQCAVCSVLPAEGENLAVYLDKSNKKVIS